MADYRDRLGEWGDAARRKARELDEKYGIKDRVEETARAASDAARWGAERAAAEAERARIEAERIGEDFDLKERAREAKERAEWAAGEASKAAAEAARLAREAAGVAGGAFRTAGQSAGARAGEVFGGAKRHYERASKVVNTGARVTRLTSAATVGAYRAVDWAKSNPKRAVTVTLSLAGGAVLGASFPALDGVLLGGHPHWFTHSALPVWAVRRAATKFDSYLRERERLIDAGELSEAERKRVEFERNAARYVGAPLLGAFSCAAGATIIAQIFQPGPIVGAPISWLLGGNPVLDTIYLFANGVVCIQQGYKFFMIALNDVEDAQRIVREIKGLLPAAATA